VRIGDKKRGGEARGRCELRWGKGDGGERVAGRGVWVRGMLGSKKEAKHSHFRSPAKKLRTIPDNGIIWTRRVTGKTHKRRDGPGGI